MGLHTRPPKRPTLLELEPITRKLALRLFALASIQWLALSCASAIIGMNIKLTVLLSLMCIACVAISYILTQEDDNAEKPPTSS